MTTNPTPSTDAALIAEATEALERAKLDSGYSRCATWAVEFGPKLIDALSRRGEGASDDKAVEE